MAQWFNDLACFCRGTRSIPSLVQWLKHLVLPYLWHRSVGADMIGNFHMSQGQPQKKKKNISHGSTFKDI